MTEEEQDDQRQRDRDVRILQSACAQLSEHFETVQIFVTRVREDGTAAAQWGAGNWYARYGQVKEWAIKQDEDARLSARSDADEG